MNPTTRRSLVVLGLGLACVAAGVGGFAWGFQTHRSKAFPYAWVRSALRSAPSAPAPETPGRWSLRDGRRPWLYDNPDAFTWEALQAIGYAEGSVLAPDAEGVLHHDEGAWPGLNLITSGHAPMALLMTLDGTEVHRWSTTADRVFPKYAAIDAEKPRAYWRRVHLLPDGGLLAMFANRGAFRLDRDSEVVWAFDDGVHHDLAVDGDSVWVLSREARVRPEHSPAPMLDDALVRLSAETGEELQRFTIWEAFAQGPYAPHLRHVRPRTDGDPLHTNTISVLDGRFESLNPAFKAGNLLISIRYTDTVAIVDPRTQQVVWAWIGPWRHQHEPTLVEPGHLLLFDNMGAWPRSRVLELDPTTQEIVWAYDGDPLPLVSETCGTAQRLPGGTTVAVASDTGVAVEVDRTGQVVWSYVNPARAGTEDELIATLFMVERIWGEDLGVFQDQAPPLRKEASGDDTPADTDADREAHP